MPSDSQLPPPVPPRPPREPVPGWMWLSFGLGPIVLGVLIGAASMFSSSNDLASGIVGGGVCGVVLALPLVVGLALSGRFFTSPAGRIGGGILFAGLLMVGLGAVAFAGCVCLLQQGNLH